MTDKFPTMDEVFNFMKTYALHHSIDKTEGITCWWIELTLYTSVGTTYYEVMGDPHAKKLRLSQIIEDNTAKDKHAEHLRMLAESFSGPEKVVTDLEGITQWLKEKGRYVG